VKQSFRIPSIVLVLGLLIAAFGVGSVLAKQADFGSLGQLDSSYAPAAAVELDQDEVSWADEDGQTVDYVKPGATSTFYILDDGLETTPSGQWDFSFTSGTVTPNQSVLDIAAQTVEGVNTAGFKSELDADGFTSSTPVVPGSLTVTGNFPVLRTPTSFVVVSPINPGATTTVEFEYHVVDEYLAENVLDGDGEVVTERDRRAKVVSTSDPQGEWVTISEVVGYGSDTASPNSNIYRGDIRLSDNAGTQGTRSDGVWVQDDDTVTVRYVNADGNAIDTDTMTADGVKPSILNISPANGAVLDASNPTLRFDVVDEGSKMDLTNLVSNELTAGAKDITVEINGSQVDGGSFQGVPERITFIYATGNKWTDAYGVRDSDPFYIRITATDVAGNTATVEREADDDGVLTGGHKITLDSTKPTATGAETGIGWDRSKAEETSNDDTAVRVTFSEDIDPASVSASDFTVGGVRPSAAVVGTTEDDADTADVNEKTTHQVYLTVAALAPDASPEVVVTGQVRDLGGSVLDTTLDEATVAARDGLDPSITVSVDTELAVKDDEVIVTIDSDERLSTTNLIEISIVGPANNGHMPDGKAKTPMQYEGTTEVPASFGSGVYGVSVRVHDVRNNDSNNLKSVTDEKSSLEDGETEIVLEMGPIADADFDGDVDEDDLTAITVGGTSTVDIASVDASSRTITLGTAATEKTDVLVSYKYVEQSFQVDIDAPEVSFSPVDEAEVENTSPFIRIIFKEDEYPGDDFKTVTLTKADLTMPDGETMSVLDGFASTDWITYLWAASDLALGEYTLKVSGEDTAGNTVEDETTSFEIVARKLVEIDLTPGWNLISLPGMPANTDVNAVITNMDVSAVVTYDPSVPGGWAQAVRETATSSLSGTLMTISGNTGIWIKTSSFEKLKVDIPPVGQGTIPPSFTLLAGWNLVPVVAVEAGVEDVDADTYLSGLKWSRAYGYESLTGTLQGFVPDGDDVVTVGKGYWVFVSEDGTLVP
jgi:hypothetical protein